MSDLNSRERVEWPARAVVTAGMPYGNKPLHFGHIGGVFVPADAFARFLRDRIGAENVRFVSGTDCFGSPINEGYRKLKEAAEFEGSIADYVLANHERQKATLEAFQVSLDIYEGSGIGHAGDVHQMISDHFPVLRLDHPSFFSKPSTDPVKRETSARSGVGRGVAHRAAQRFLTAICRMPGRGAPSR